MSQSLIGNVIQIEKAGDTKHPVKLSQSLIGNVIHPLRKDKKSFEDLYMSQSLIGNVILPTGNGKVKIQNKKPSQSLIGNVIHKNSKYDYLVSPSLNLS